MSEILTTLGVLLIIAGSLIRPVEEKWTHKHTQYNSKGEIIQVTFDHSDR